MMRRLLVVVFVALCAPVPARAQAIVVATHSDAPPEQLEESLDAVLATGGQRITIGSNTLAFWWVKSLPLRIDSHEASWGSVEEGTLIGAVELFGSPRDARGTALKPGVYTLRYALRPADAAHQGVSTRREVLLLAPAEADASTAAVGHDAAVSLARLADASHPPSWSLDVPDAAESPLSVHESGSGNKAVVFSVPVSRDGSDVGALQFALVLAGATGS